MALVVYDHGYRIQTPVNSLLPNRTVEELTEPHAGRGIPSSEHQTEPPRADRPVIQARPRQQQGNKARQAYQDMSQLNRRQSDRPNFLVNKIMTKPVITVPMDAPLTGAWDLMNRYQIQHLAVVSRDNRLLGVLTDSDLLRRHAYLPHAGPVNLRNSIEGAYPSKLVVASPDTLVREAAMVMFEHRVSCIPVVNAEHRPVGMVTRSDLLPLIINDRRFEQWI